MGSFGGRPLPGPGEGKKSWTMSAISVHLVFFQRRTQWIARYPLWHQYSSGLARERLAFVFSLSPCLHSSFHSSSREFLILYMLNLFLGNAETSICDNMHGAICYLLFAFAAYVLLQACNHPNVRDKYSRHQDLFHSNPPFPPNSFQAPRCLELLVMLLVFPKLFR